MRLTASALLFFILLSLTHVRGQKPKTSAAPNWVTHNIINTGNSKLDGDAEDGYIDVAFEKQVCLPEQTTFYKKVIKVLTEAGIQNSSDVSVNFDPTYETLIFHSIHILRNNQKIERLDLNKIKTIQQEKDLERFLYDGSKTSVLFLEDVRKGDIIEYSYSIKGTNPIFKGKYSDMLETKFSVPVYHLYYKLITEPDRELTIKTKQTDIIPRVTNKDKFKIYEWQSSDITPLNVPNNTPSWFDPYPYVMISEYKTWREVDEWAMKLFPFDTPISGELLQKVDEIKQNKKTQEELVLASLHFVQDEIRYLGIEIGESSHKPSLPEKTFKQRFGDCKDKSYLLCTILRHLGIEANPVLINTGYKKTITEWLPSPTHFDHTIVRVNLDTSSYWLDPTLAYQRGPLNKIFFPDYQVGLDVNSETTELTNIPFRKTESVKIKETFKVTDMSGVASFYVKTNYSGSSADGARENFRSNSRNEIQKTYLDFYSGYFNNIKADSIDYFDDEQTGLFSTFEYYTVKDFWGESRSLQDASFQPYVIDGVIRKIKDKNRTVPFSLPFPASYDEEIEIQLPEKWNIKTFSQQFSCSNFVLSLDYSCSGKMVSLKYHYENLKDHVLPDEFEPFNTSLAKANESLGYSLSSTTVSDTGVTSGSTYNYLYVALGLCAFVTFLVRKNRR